jgi:hypothetical protein
MLALHLIEQSARDGSSTKFFHFWTALEVLIGTHRTAVIANCLVRAYGCDRAFVSNVLGFDEITRRRQRLFHEGEAHDIPQDVEGYLQAMFKDLLREELGLAPLKLMGQQLNASFRIERLHPEISTTNVGTFSFSAGAAST